MAKKSVINRNDKRIKLCAKYRVLRTELKQKIYNKNITLAEREELYIALDKLPRDSALARVRRRCQITGRGNGCYRKFEISRIIFRKFAGDGLLPGIQKSSW